MSAPRPQVAASALRLALSHSSARPGQFVCHACRRHATRSLHTSQSRLAERPWHQRMTESLFGSKESRDAEKGRAEKREKKIADVKASGGAEAVAVDINGRSYKIAPFVDPATEPGYQRSTNAKGLKTVGTLNWSERQADNQEPFVGFAPARAEKLPERQWTALLQLTAIELFALRRAGRDLAQISHSRTQLPLDALINNEVTLQSDSADHVTFLNSTAESGLLDNISTSEEPVSQESLVELVQGIKNGVESGKWAMPSTGSWSAIALQDPAIKLAIHKRVFQLTGKRLPDVALMRATNLEQLRQEYLTKPPPAKLAKDTKFVRVGQEMPNVRIMRKKRSPKAMETEIGRFKLVQEEFHRRGLPLKGTNFPSGAPYSPVSGDIRHKRAKAAKAATR